MIASRQNQAIKPAFARCKQVGVELEGFSHRENCDGLQNVEGGHCTTDAGFNLLEFITAPHQSVADAFSTLRQLDSINGGMIYTPSRPLELMHNQGKWQSNPRYDAMRVALEAEAPGNADLVQTMTETAALQVNFSGAIDPFGEDGVFLINMFNDLAPYLAKQVHQELGFGAGHLSIWRQFALPQRFPQAGRWFSDADNMISYIESVPKLFRFNDLGEIEKSCGEKQDVKEPVDLSFMWWFLRPKLSPEGVAYLESRYLPSMPLDAAEHYTQQTIDIVEVLLDWFHGTNKGVVVATQTSATPAYRYLAKNLDYVPAYSLSMVEWVSFFHS